MIAVLPALREMMTQQQQMSEHQAIGGAYVSTAEMDFISSVHSSHNLMIARVQDTFRGSETHEDYIHENDIHKVDQESE